MAAVETQVDPTTAAQVLYERHSGRLFGYFVNQLGSRDEAEDALQTTFLHAVRGLRRGVIPVAEWPWLLTIARNVCFTRWETARRRRAFESPHDPHVIEESAPAAVEQAAIPLQQALAVLPDQQRRAIVMRELQGLSYREIADELGVSVGAVESLLFRARGSLAKQLRGRRALDLGSLVAGAKSLFTGGAVAFKIAVIAGVTGASAIAGAATLAGGGADDPVRPAPDSRPLAVTPPVQVPARSEARPTPAVETEAKSVAGSITPPAGASPVPTSEVNDAPAPPTERAKASSPSSPSESPPAETSSPVTPPLEVPTVSTDPVTEVTKPVVDTVGGAVEDVKGTVDEVVEELPAAPPALPIVPVPETPTVPVPLP